MIDFNVSDIYELIQFLEREKASYKGDFQAMYEKRKEVERAIEELRKKLHEARASLVASRDAANQAANSSEAEASNARSRAYYYSNEAYYAEGDEYRSDCSRAARSLNEKADYYANQASACRSQANACSAKISKIDSRLSEIDHYKAEFTREANVSEGMLQGAYNALDTLSMYASRAYNAVNGTFHSCRLNTVEDLEYLKKDLDDLMYKFSELSEAIDSDLESMNNALGGASWLEGVTKGVKDSSKFVYDGQYGLKERIKQLETYIAALREYLSVRV